MFAAELHSHGRADSNGGAKCLVVMVRVRGKTKRRVVKVWFAEAQAANSRIAWSGTMCSQSVPTACGAYLVGP
jgi:hypothetical protein